MTRADFFRRLRVVAAVVVVVACGGSACAVIPVGGPYSVGEVGGGDPMNKPFQRMVAVRPQQTWTAEQVVRGLQAAMAAYADDPSVLPYYLTDEAKQAWTPGGPVTVIDNQYKYRDETKQDDKVTTIVLSGAEMARIEDDDTYVPAARSVDRRFTLVKDEQGGYKVSSLANGLLLTQADVDRAYRPTKLYYLNAAPGSGGGG
ncbi:hypothetical protein, partial [Nonomuraea rhizosphaerae]|uniref:hypothetical protein n=1 Tax=Nonomuraea rhizosphaerae TaxID=2665663 RepID=UPI001C5CCB8A